jgi:hypothetical protein
MCDKGARQAALDNVISDLEAQVITGNVLLQLGRLWRVEFHLKRQLPRIVTEEFGDWALELQPHTRILWCRVNKAEIVLFENVQSGTYGIEYVLSLCFTLKSKKKSLDI